MALITRDQVTPPAPAEEIVHLGGLGAEVRVRGIGLAELMTFYADAKSQDNRDFYSRLAARLVLAADDHPLWPDPADWDIWFGSHAADFEAIRAAMTRVLGNVADAKKNSEPTPA